MAELPCVGFYLFGVEEVKMEAHHHGGGRLGWRTRWRSSLLEVSTYLGGGQDGGAPLWRFGVKDVKMEAHHHGGGCLG